MHDTQNTVKTQTPPRSRRPILWFLLGLTVCLCAAASWLWLKQPSTPRPHPFQPPEMAAAQFSRSVVIGDLGGMSVSIPRHFAEYVEYDGDPGFGEKRKGPRPERTQASKLMSFGFKARYPDMAGLDSPAMKADKRQQTIYNTMWIDVGIGTGSIYPGDGFLDRRTNSINSPGAFFHYVLLPEPQHNLSVYAVVGTDPKTQRPFREHDNADDIFVHRNKKGQVNTYIWCSNRPHQAAPCRHTFSLEPNIKAKVEVGYRRGLLPEWQSIQRNVAQKVLSFKVAESSASPTSAPSH